MYSKEEKLALLKLPLDEKIKRGQTLILDWYYQFNGNIYVSYSGGKDSSVLLHLVRSLKTCKDVVGVFSDTGLEYPEVRQHVKDTENIIWIKPKLTFKQVIEKYGYPIISKEQSRYLYDIQTSKSEKLKTKRLLGGKAVGSNFNGCISKKWKPLINADFKISNKCCDKMKKEPFHRFEKESGLKPVLGTMAEESALRLAKYMKGECNAFNATRPVSNPIYFWTEQDILKYIVDNNIKIPSIYGEIILKNGRYYTTGCNRTGCMFCMYGLHLENHPNRLERMEKTHPTQYRYIMEKLNGKHVMDTYLECTIKSS